MSTTAHPRIEPVSIFIVWLFIVSALVGIYLGHFDWFVPKTPFNLMLVAGLLLINLPVDTPQKWAAFAIAFVAGMLVEMLGVASGVIFGIYSYGANLGPKVLAVPLTIGLNWAVLTLSTSMIARQFSSSKYVIIPLGAAVMVGLDVLMEQVSCPLDFWCFEGDHAPLQNYLAWYIVAIALQWSTLRLVPEAAAQRFSQQLILSQAVFFALLYVMLRGAGS